MSKHYLRNTIFLLVGAFVFTSLGMGLLLQPLLNYLSGGTKIAPTGTSGLSGIAVSIFALLLSVASVAFTAKGIKRDSSRRWVWIVLLIIGIVLLIQAIGLTAMAPMFPEMYKNLKP